MAKMTIKNTKSEILEALNASLEKIKALELSKDDPVAKSTQNKEKEAIKSADETVQQNIFSEDLIKKYEDLKLAIATKEALLKDLYGIEIEAQTLVALINAHKDKVAELNEDYAQKTIELDKAIATKKEEINNEIKNLEEHLKSEKLKINNELKEYKENNLKSRSREEEEYTYSLQREHKKANDEWEDEKASREKAIAELEKQTKEKLQEALDKEKEFEELKAKVEDIPNVVEKAEKAAIEKTTKELGKEYGYKKAMAEKEQTYELKILNEKIGRLEQSLAEMQASNTELRTKLDNAYAQLRDLATETVKSSGGIKILNSENNYNQKRA